jgi:hypothetical protein
MDCVLVIWVVREGVGVSVACWALLVQVSNRSGTSLGRIIV